ncbi:hypothetical protein [Ruixingdingia sedimenti]|uniref:Cation transport ATPase n=1 Tax=Ruixingdingia sedimenti TaxID=3073604 RepID=A0ABU1F3I0_9RHOB|nr:hypothetical protein [Xinfangfangia sp. LG-4]MDR5651009.1 hypothetical protein [Xinfangfangia sp. LG-4]
MSIWTNRRAALALALMALAPGGAGAEGAAPARIALAGGEVVIRGPRGYCADPGAVRGATMAVLAGCDSLAPGGAAPRDRAILTAAVTPGGLGLPLDAATEVLVAWFTSREGLAALSRAGKPETVMVHEARRSKGAFSLHLSDRAPFPGGAVAPGYWRAILDLGGHVVTLSVYAPAAAALDREAGFAILRDFVAAVQAENRARPVAAAPE